MSIEKNFEKKFIFLLKLKYFEIIDYFKGKENFNRFLNGILLDDFFIRVISYII